MLVLLLSTRQLTNLTHHINAHSSFTVGAIWRALVGVVVPIVLVWMFISGVIGVIREPYEGYPIWYNTLFGWGAVILMVVAAAIVTALRWRKPVDDFTPEPALPGERIDATPVGRHQQGDH
jgi:NSS family neurotransmitter:Na+ symporter